AEYLVKPVEPEKLLNVVRHYCRRQAEEPSSHILIIEDDQALAELAARTLRSAGWPVEVAFDGETGLAAALARPPGLILLDYMLPKMDGLQLLEHLRADPVGQTIPVILMTARDLSVEDRQRLARTVNAIQRKAELDLEQIIIRIRQLMQRNLASSTANTIQN
ncbi:response regulator, partial [Chloroflexus sp.]|uniref:response regulator transcription factor n=1 Tax=Chloroflexus sp. TaxID=1904827 RepID=UPI002ACEA437